MYILVVNPGSTSTKISVFEDERELFCESIFHDAPVLLSFKTVNDQLPFRKQVIIDILKKHNFSLDQMDAFVGRGGSAHSQSEGVIEIDETLSLDCANDVGGSDHPAKLGVMLSYEFSREYGKKSYTLNATNVDEYIDEARITGIKGLYKKAQAHVLNQKGIARLHCKNNNLEYEKSSLIVCHIDGGITINAHKNGLMIDGTQGAGGDGPLTPTRIGSIPVLEVLRFIKEHPEVDLSQACSRSGGFVSHFGSSSADYIYSLVQQNDEHAMKVWNTMAYQICKEIGAMAAVLDGHVDGILLTGGLVRFQTLVDYIKSKTSWISKIYVYKGEVEQEVLALEVLKVLRGEVKAKKYTKESIFKGFSWD